MTTRPTWTARTPVIVGGVALGVLIGGFGLWSTQVEIAGAIVGSGQIMVDTDKQVINHPIDGVVVELPVRNGDRVEAGDLLVRLDDSDLRSRLNAAEGELFELLAKEARLRAEVDQTNELDLDEVLARAVEQDPSIGRLVARQRRQLRDDLAMLEKNQDLILRRIAQIEQQIEGLTLQYEAKRQQIELVAAEVVTARDLRRRGLMRAAELTALLKEDALTRGEAGDYRARIGELSARITEFELEALKLPVEFRANAAEALSKLVQQRVKLAESRADLIAKLARQEIRAPISGTIHDSQVLGLKSVVQEGKPIMYIIPGARPVVAEVKVEATDIDQVYAGQIATLRFPAFNQRSTPLLKAQVETVSADAFLDPRTNRSHFKVRVVIAETERAALGAQDLVPGMPVEAHFSTGSHTPMTYILKPVGDYLARAFKT